MALAEIGVRLSAQIDEFSKTFNNAVTVVDGFKTSFEKTSASVSKAAETIGSTFAKMGVAIAAIGVAVVGAIAAFEAFKAVVGIIKAVGESLRDFVAHTAEVGDSLFDLSNRTGLSVESLSALKFAAGQTGTSLESITGAVFKMEASLGAGTKKTTEALNALGLSLKDLRAADPSVAFTSIIQQLSELPNASARAAAGVAIFGKSFKDIANLSKEDLPALIDKARELGLVMSTETAVAADKFHDALGELEGAMEGLRLQIGAKLLPAVLAFTESFGTAWTETAKQATSSAAHFGDAIDTLVPQVARGAAKLIEVFATMVDAVTQWAASSVLAFGGVIQAQIDLANTAIKVARVMDQATGGNLSAVFDQMTANVKQAQDALDALVKPVLVAGAGLHALAAQVEATAKSAGENFAATYKRIQEEVDTAAAKMRKGLKSIGDGGGLEKTEKAAKDMTEELFKAYDAVRKIDLALEKFGTADMAAEMKELAKITNDAVDSMDKRLTKFAATTDAVSDKIATDLLALQQPVTSGLGGLFGGGLGFTAGQINSFATFGQKASEAAETPFRDAFGQLGKDLPGIIFGALQGGGSVLGSIAAALGAQFSHTFQKALADAGGDLSKVGAGSKALGIAGGAISAGFTGFALGQSLGKGKGALAGAASGALAGSVAGPIGTAVGAGVGALAGFFGGRSADKKAKQQMEDQKIALQQQFGGMTKLKELATKLGVNIQAAFDAKKPEQFTKAVEELNAAIDVQNKRTEGLGIALDGVNKRAESFGKKFQTLIDAQKSAAQTGDTGAAAAAAVKLMEATATSQAEFERLGVLVSGVFGGMVKDTGNAYDAIQQLAPSFQVLKDGVSSFGLTSSAVIDELLADFDLVNSAAFGPLLENVQNTGAVLKGLGDGISPAVFQAAAADIGQSLQEIANRGGDIGRALALSQPVLQDLFEKQQKFGGITDQTTQAILDQAKAQGLVGDQMKGVNQQILDVLLAIGKVLHADLPAYFKDLTTPAKQAAQGIEDAFSNISIDIPYRYTQEGEDPRIQTAGVPALAGGGIVRRPTLALIGEKGPEAVVPLGRDAMGMGGDQVVTINNIMDGEVLTRNVLRLAPGVLRKYGA